MPKRGCEAFSRRGDHLAFGGALDKASRMRPWFPVALAYCALSCNDELVEDVPPEVCVSGHRWVGGKRGSEEMYPGRDCVGCHLENDGPQLMAGGTVYSIAASNPMILQVAGRPQATDCFGLEGVKVTITADDLEELTTYTNRAGNFFFEGRPGELAKPIFKVQIEYPDPLTGAPIVKPMSTQPSYGGCARCHTLGLPETPFDLAPPADQALSQAGDYIDIGLPITDFINAPAAAASEPQ